MRRFLIFTILFFSFAFLLGSPAQEGTQWRVPESSEVRANRTIAINAITFSTDGTQLAVATANGITVSDTYTGKELARFPVLPDPVTALAFSPDNRTVASASEAAAIHLWDARTGEHSTDFIGHTHPVVTLAFSPDGNTLASGSFKEIRIWNLATAPPTPISIFRGHRDMVTTLAFSPDSKTLASTSFYGTILLWDVETGQRRHSLYAHTDSVLALAFSPDNQLLASGGYWNTDAENTIRLWNVHTGQLTATFADHTAPVFALAFAPDVHSVHGGPLASAGWDNTIRLWHPRTGQLQTILEGNTAPVFALAFLPDVTGSHGKTLARHQSRWHNSAEIAERIRCPSSVGCQRRWYCKYFGFDLYRLAFRREFTRPQRRRYRQHFGFNTRRTAYRGIGSRRINQQQMTLHRRICNLTQDRLHGKIAMLNQIPKRRTDP